MKKTKLFLLILGSTIIFGLAKTTSAQSCPSYTTYSDTWATLVGEITDDGGDPNLEVWFKWGRNYSLYNETYHQYIYVSYLPYRFCATISNLEPCTTYYYQAVAKNSEGINLGELRTFTTRCQLPQPPQPSNQLPKAIIDYSPKNITPGTLVTFDASRSYDPDGSIVAYEWRINGELVSNSRFFTRALPSGNFKVELKVIDNNGLSDFDTVHINVGRNVFVTRTITQRVIQPTPATTRLAVFGNLVDLFSESSYSIKKCSKNYITFEVQNNTKVRRQVNMEVVGKVSDWFDPKNLSFIVYPKEREKISWEVDVPCYVKEGEYLVTLKVTTPGDRIEKELVLKVVEERIASNTLTLKAVEEKTASGALAFVNSSSVFNSLWWLLFIILILLVISIIIEIFLWKKVNEEQKEIKKRLEIIQKLQSVNTSQTS